MKQFGFRIFLAIVVVAVVSAIVAGLWTVGSPSQERARQYDQQRMNELQQIANAIDQYWSRTGLLPADLNVLVSRRDYYLPSLVDPRTGRPYESRVAGEKTFELCAVFATVVAEDPRLPKPYVEPYLQRFWQHGVGRTCFSLEPQKQPVP